ncbi:hypothetical protein BN961_00052 [Afipia felis]|uniref:Uncharacterized protein n=1 Tax=Afipia felis TaxID=1035 RepID=A0A090MK45_AFIFE|nr:hypothetical protein BN961_00052 [Afipia felis]
MPGPKMPRPRSDKAARTMAIASSTDGVLPPNPCVNWLNSVEPIPMTTASTSTLMPDETTFPRTLSAMKAVLPNRPNGISTNPASVDSLNSISVTKSWIARMKKARMTSAQANSRQAIWIRFSNTAIQPINGEMDSSNGRAASRPVCATLPGRSRSCTVKPVPLAFRPRPAKLSKMIFARLFQLEMR